MAVILYNDVTRIRILPLHELRLSYGSGGLGVNVFLFQYPESDSSASMRRISEPDGDGGSDTVAYRVEATWYVPFNDFDTMRATLEQIALERPQDMSMKLRAQDDQPGGALLTVDLSETSKILSISAGWDWETAAFRPRMVITANCLFLPELLSVVTESRLFKQGSGWDE